MIAVSLGLVLPATAGYAISRTPDHTPVWPNIIATTTRTVTVQGHYKGLSARRWAARSLQAAHTAHRMAGRARDLRRVLLARPNVIEAINLACAVYGFCSTLWRKAECESRLEPGAYNSSSGSAGLFQFLGSTWRSTPFGRFSIWSPYASALAAGWMHATGRGGEWSCR